MADDAPKAPPSSKELVAIHDPSFPEQFDLDSLGPLRRALNAVIEAQLRPKTPSQEEKP